MASIYYLESYVDEDVVAELEEKAEDGEDVVTPLDAYIAIHAIPLKRGDILGLREECYRNTGKHIWTGTSIVDLANDEDEYGHIPREFSCPDEFPPFHWKDVIEHNSLVPVRLTTQRRDELRTNLQATICLADLYMATSSFTCNGETYRVVFSADSDPKESVHATLNGEDDVVYMTYEPLEDVPVEADNKTLFLHYY
jgi:hypothetical protein